MIENDKPCQWGKALSLTECIHVMRCVTNVGDCKHNNRSKADRLLQQWKQQTPFVADSAYFTRRLASVSLCEADLLNLLEVPSEYIEQHCSTIPDWLVQFDRAYTTSKPSYELPYSNTIRNHHMAGLLVVVEPLLYQAYEHLCVGVQDVIDKVPSSLDISDIMAQLFEPLPHRFLWMISRPLVLELHIARLREQLQGNTPEARYASFVDKLRDQVAARTLLIEYPVLVRQLMQCLDQWLTNSVTLAQRLVADWPLIQRTFGLSSNTDIIITIQHGVGDRHDGGQTVDIITFHSGFRIVYKPRSLKMDVHFQELLQWFNSHKTGLPFRTLRIVDQEDYGWVEYVPHTMCTDESDIQKFYQRQGAYLALLYVLNASDFHHENIIACGEHPVLIDLEALFGPQQRNDPDEDGETLGHLALIESVMRVSLLPHRLRSKQHKLKEDMSGIGARTDQDSDEMLPLWIDAGTDTIHMVRGQAVTDASEHLPTSADTLNITHYLDPIIHGFVEMYRFIADHREQLLNLGGPLSPFLHDTVRVLVRHTMYYSKILNESYHPDVLRSALDRDRLFDRLWFEVPYRPTLEPLIPNEHTDLWCDDVPLFTTTPTSRTLWSSQGGIFEDFLERPGIEIVQERLHKLSEADLEDQLQMIRFSFTSLVPTVHQAALSQNYLRSVEYQADRDLMIKQACEVANHLLRKALRSSKNITWLSLTPDMIVEPAGLDMYDGLPGIALFLGYLGSLTKNEYYTSEAQRVLEEILQQIEKKQHKMSSVGAFVGWGGIVYTLTHLGVLWQDTTLLKQAIKFVELLPPLVSQDSELDIIGGSAGCIAALLVLYHCAPHRHILAVAQYCGDYLISQAQTQTHGIAWPSMLAPDQPLGGFAHGCSGIAWALYELAIATRDIQYRTAALSAIAYDQSLFVPETGNWRDTRDERQINKPLENQVETGMVAWCYGASGIGMTRLAMLRHHHNESWATDVQRAISLTLTHGFGMNHSLCHGDLGNLDLLVQANQQKHDPQLAQRTSQLGTMIVDSLCHVGYRCGTAFNAETPGLMTGLAGIGYGLLRLALPKDIPSVLTLASPPS